MMELSEILWRFSDREPIHRGWSSDKKYRISDENGGRYLLRISDISTREAKLTEFSMMQKAEKTGIAMCRPIACGETDEGFCVVHSWVDGVDLETVLPSFSGEQQYRLGITAGDALRRIHSIPAPASVEDWNVRYHRKIDRKIRNYHACPIKYDRGEVFLSYLEENRACLSERPQCFQHGDFHAGNMMLSTAGELYIIDFNRSDFGDPWEEFNRIVWSAQCSPAFASGCVDGYFANGVPMLFWRLLALYIVSNTLSSLPWAVPFGEGEIATMRRQAEEVLTWYDDMRRIVPSWYQPMRKET